MATPSYTTQPSLLTKNQRPTKNNSNLLHLPPSPPHNTLTPSLHYYFLFILIYYKLYINLSSPHSSSFLPIPPPPLSFFFFFSLSLSYAHTPHQRNTHTTLSPFHDCYHPNVKMLNDDWVRAAMTDETFVVEVLLRLKQTVSTESHHRLPLSWGLKQPRSRSRLATAVSRCDAAVSTRCSPTTPLSWSSGASPSATADGYEDSSRQHHAARSKVIFLSLYLSLRFFWSLLCSQTSVVSPLRLRVRVTPSAFRDLR